MSRSSNRRSKRKLARKLAAAVPLFLAAWGFSVQAAELSTQGSAKRPLHHSSAPAPKTTPKSTRSTKSLRNSPSASTKVKRKKLRRGRDDLEFRSGAVLVVDQDTGETVAAKNADTVMPVASLTKLMTALVVLNGNLPLDEMLEIGDEDVDREKHTHSRLKVGTRLSRDEMLLLALMSSENRAAMALSRHYPGGRAAFLNKMNQEAQSLGMSSTHFADAAGLSSRSVSSARDLHRLLSAAYARPLIRDYSTQAQGIVRVKGRPLTFINSNRLVRKSGSDWDIELQKTGFTNEAGRCLIMQATVLSRRLAMIFLDSTGTMTRYADAARVRRRLERDAKARPAPAGVTAAATETT